MPGLRHLLVAVAIPLVCPHAWGLDVNQASEAELDGVRGLGPASTARILEARQNGPFKDWADLMHRVKGIKPATARELSESGLTVGERPFEAHTTVQP